MRHNRRMPKQTSVQRWRCPAVVRVKSFLFAVAGVAIAVVFFPLWFAVPVAAVLAAWGLGMAVLGSSVLLDEGPDPAAGPAAGRLTLRVGLLVRRIRLTDVTAVLVEEAKVSIGRVNGPEISLFAWRKGPLDALLGVPAVASDIGHAISKAVALAQARDGAPAAARPAGRRTTARTRSRLATALLGGAGVLAIAGALLVRVHWDSPALTVLSVVIALALGVFGLLYLLVALWIALTGRAPRVMTSL
jgi:hypothetical protein